MLTRLNKWMLNGTKVIGQCRTNKTIIDKFFRTRNELPEDEMKFERLPSRPLEPEDQPHANAMKQMPMEEDGNDERNVGPYPRVPQVHYSQRDPWAKWDYPQMRRNWNEPVPYNYELFGMHAPQPDPDTPFWQSLSVVSFFLALSYGLYRVIEYFGDKYGDAYIAAGYGPQRAGPVPYIQDIFPDPDHLLKHPYVDRRRW